MADFHGDGRLGGIRIKTGAGNIALDQTGPAHLSSGAGSVNVERTVGSTEITGAGDMNIGAIEGEATLNNLNGKTWVGEVTGGLRAKSANGDITVERAHRGVTAKTANGHIHVGEITQGSVVLETASGGVDIGVRQGTTAFLDVNTRFGRIHSSLDAASAPEPSEETAEIRARTAFGDIVIHRS